MWIHDVLENRELRSSIYSGLPLVGTERVKTSGNLWNEIAAYQLANFLGLPVPRMRCFLSTKDLLVNKVSVKIGSPILLIEDVGKQADNFESVRNNSWDLLWRTRYMAFFVFRGGSEYPEVHNGSQDTYLIDLEMIFAISPADDSDLESHLSNYDVLSESEFKSWYCKAMKGGFDDEFINAVKDVIAKIDGGFALDFQVPPTLSYVPRFIFDSIKRRCLSLKSFCTLLD